MCGSFKSGGKCAVKHFYETFFVVQSNIFTNFANPKTIPNICLRRIDISGAPKHPPHQLFLMLKAALEKVINEDMAEIWSVLSADEKRFVTDNLQIHSFKKNQLIYAEGDEPEFLWVLLKGKVKKIKEGVGGRVQILRLIRPVQYFGYRAFFAGEPYVSSAAAFEPSTLGAVPLHIVRDLIQNNMKLAWFFIHELSRNLGGSDTKIVNLTQKHIRGRLAEALVVLADNYGYEDDNCTLKIYMSREDLANLSNMTTSNAIRTLTTFVNEHLLIVDGRRIKIINEPQLRKISKFG